MGITSTFYAKKRRRKRKNLAVTFAGKNKRWRIHYKSKIQMWIELWIFTSSQNGDEIPNMFNLYIINITIEDQKIKKREIKSR